MRNTKVLCPSPTAILRAAHSRLRGLLARYGAPGWEEVGRKGRLVRQIRQELDLHLEILEVLLYPAIQKMSVERSDPVVMRALRDHRKVKTLLDGLKELDSDGKALDAKMNALKHCVLRHLDLEESQVLPHSQNLSPEALQGLSNDMEALRDRRRTNHGRRQPLQQAQTPLYPTLQNVSVAPEDDRDAPHSPGPSEESHDPRPSDFYNWGR